jgi:pimeloyl-ACP methyl ester carboxylesterase
MRIYQTTEKRPPFADYNIDYMWSSKESKPVESGYAPVNGIKMYYEVHGKGEGAPLILLHGGGSTIDVTFSKVLPIFAQHRKVIALEEQGHGRTSDRNQPVRFETSADDVAALLAHLNIEKGDLFGFSNGASVALQVAIRHPQCARKLIFASSMTKKDGAHPQFWSFMKQANFSNMPQPLKDAFLKVNPDTQKLRTMHDKDADRMLNFKDVSDREVRSIRSRSFLTLLVFSNESLRGKAIPAQVPQPFPSPAVPASFLCPSDSLRDHRRCGSRGGVVRRPQADSRCTPQPHLEQF